MSLFTPRFEISDFKRSDDLCHVSFRQPGFNQTDYTRDGNLSVQSLMRISTTGENIPFGNDVNRSLLANEWQSNKDATTFSLKFDLIVSDAIYNPGVSKSELLFDVSLFHVGKSSVKILTQVFVKEIPNQPILSYVHHIVRVDFITRKPLSWPTWIAEAVDKGEKTLSSGHDLSSKRTEKLSRPSHTFVYSVHVPWSDTDENNHCNFASYVKYADDALRAALRLRDAKRKETPIAMSASSRCHQLEASPAGSDTFILYQGDPSLALRSFRKETQECGVKHMNIHFFQECKEDDLLRVHIWQDGVKDNVVFSSVEKNEELISQMVIEYFTSKSKL